MGVIKKYIFRSNKDKGRLLIGGVSSVINTPALLAAKFTFDEYNVSNFTIDGSDIYADISGGDYDTVSAAFRADSTITSIQELGGKLKTLAYQTFRECANLVLIDLIGVTSFGAELCYLSSSLHVNNILLPNLLTANSANSSFQGIHASVGETFSFPLATSITGSNVFRFFEYTIDAPECLTFGSGDTCAFGEGILNIPKVTNLGGSVIDNEVFRLSVSGMVINANTFLQTNNGGSPDGDLTYASGRGAIINYI